MATGYWIILAVASLISLRLSIFIYRNFDEVISRRMLYRNSNVDMYEAQMSYTVGQFMNIASALITLGVAVFLLPDIFQALV